MEKHQAKVYYQKTADGKNKVIKLEGFLNRKDLENLGEEVFRLWDNQEHKMYLGESSIYINRGSNLHYSVFSDEEFTRIISEMKLCGKVLSKILKDVAESEAKEVKVISI